MELILEAWMEWHDLYDDHVCSIDCMAFLGGDTREWLGFGWVGWIGIDTSLLIDISTLLQY